MNEENLKSFDKLTVNEQRETAVKGGIASGAARRRKKSMEEVAKMILAMPVKDVRTRKQLSDIGFDPDDDSVTNQIAVMVSMQNKAILGNVQAAEFLRDTVGENPVAKARKEELKQRKAEFKYQKEKAALDTVVSNEGFELPARVVARSFVDTHRDILAKRHTEYVFEGGRGSTKSSFVSLQIVDLIKNNPMMHAVCCRKVASSLRDSVFSQIQWAIDELNLSEEFKATTNPLEITYLPTNQKIYFRGVDKPEKLKSIKPKFGYIGILWFEELDQFSGDEECRNVQQSVIRGGDDAYIFKSFNPPKSQNNWANLYVKLPKDNRIVNHSDYTAVPREWLGNAFIEDAEWLKEIKPDAYEHEYLGIPNGNGGQVFENIEPAEITTEEINSFDNIHRGLDWGYYPDPWAFNVCHYDAARRTLYIFDELEERKKGNRETADILFNHGIGSEDLITADSAEQKSIADYRGYGIKCYAAVKGPNSREYSYKWLQSLVKIVIDPVRCPRTLNEFINYEYERTKDGEIMSGYPDGNDHHIDAIRYATERIWRKRGQ